MQYIRNLFGLHTAPSSDRSRIFRQRHALSFTGPMTSPPHHHDKRFSLFITYVQLFRGVRLMFMQPCYDTSQCVFKPNDVIMLNKSYLRYNNNVCVHALCYVTIHVQPARCHNAEQAYLRNNNNVRHSVTMTRPFKWHVSQDSTTLFCPIH